MKFRRTEEEDYSLQLTPLIDVVFLLLIFFMVSTAFIDFTRKMDIDLPESSLGATPEQTKVFEIEMSVDGKIYLNGREVTLQSLPPALATASESTKRSAIIRADKKVNHGNVVKVMEICRDAEIADLGIAVQ
ncbi:Biopolymer transport protein ExbD/TolR [hydrothermal vent metagenome]|uniref:Biopolymer transport protein ExbD/TolR n=1 Tax=hydrothermal vent metagenome TaxID=652676 RepID=A0A3B1CE75_9ZZZZ